MFKKLGNDDDGLGMTGPVIEVKKVLDNPHKEETEASEDDEAEEDKN